MGEYAPPTAPSEDEMVALAKAHNADAVSITFISRNAAPCPDKSCTGYHVWGTDWNVTHNDAHGIASKTIAQYGLDKCDEK